MNTEASRITGAISALILAIFNVLAVFGYAVADSTQQSIIVAVTAMFNLFFTMGGFEFVRSKVFSLQTTERLVQNAAITGVVPANLDPPTGGV